MDFDTYLASVVGNPRRPGHAKASSLTTRTTRTTHDSAEARIGDVKAPVLVVMGEKDPDFPNPREKAEWVAGALDGTVLTVPDAGHYPWSQRPDLVGSAIVVFARGIDAATKSAGSL